MSCGARGPVVLGHRGEEPPVDGAEVGEHRLVQQPAHPGQGGAHGELGDVERDDGGVAGMAPQLGADELDEERVAAAGPGRQVEGLRIDAPSAVDDRGLEGVAGLGQVDVAELVAGPAAQEREHLVLEQQVLHGGREAGGDERDRALLAEAVLDRGAELTQLVTVTAVDLVDRQHETTAGTRAGDDVGHLRQLGPQVRAVRESGGGLPLRSDAEPGHRLETPAVEVRPDPPQQLGQPLLHEAVEQPWRRRLGDDVPAVGAGEVLDLVEHHRLARAAAADEQARPLHRPGTLGQSEGEVLEDLVAPGEHRRRDAERRPERVPPRHGGACFRAH